MKRALDYAIFPVLVLASTWAAWVLVGRGVPPLAVTPICVSVLTAIVFALERVRPESTEPRESDNPLFVEALHFVLSFELGYGLSLLALEGIGRVFAAPRWPTSWPLPLQILIAVLMYEGTSYWQHRWLHKYDRLFRIHALHHSGARLVFMRAVRFHALDIGTASFVAYLPLTLLGAPDSLYAVLGVFLSALGMLQHANIRVRTPWWLDRMICTPAVHRHHHSTVREENDTNFCNTVMLFDLLFGTYGAPRPDRPKTFGLERDPVPRGFLGQWLAHDTDVRPRRS